MVVRLLVVHPLRLHVGREEIGEFKRYHYVEACYRVWSVASQNLFVTTLPREAVLRCTGNRVVLVSRIVSYSR